jgi:hypothetical protein
MQVSEYFEYKQECPGSQGCSSHLHMFAYKFNHFLCRGPEPVLNKSNAVLSLS